MIAHLIHLLTMAVAEQVAVQGGWGVGDGVPVIEPEHIFGKFSFQPVCNKKSFQRKLLIIYSQA